MAAIKRLAHWMNSEDARAPVAACNVLLDRGYGKPQQMLEVTYPDDFDYASDAELNKHILEQMIEILCDPEILSAGGHRACQRRREPKRL